MIFRLKLTMYKNISHSNYFLVVVFVGIYFFVRWPLFSLGWDGHDGSGHDLHIFLNHPTGPNYLLVYKVRDLIQYGIPQHPALPYEIISWLGYLYQKIIDYKNYSYEQIIFHIKLLVSIVQLFFYIALIFIILKLTKNHKIRLQIIILLSLFSISPLSINNSNEFQMDSLIGLSMLGLYSLVLVAFSKNLFTKKIAYPLIFLTSTYIGLGKTEWSLFLMCSIVISGAYFLWLNIFSLDKKDLNVHNGYLILVVFLGCIFGNLLSYQIDVVNYLAGWDLVLRESPRSTVFSKDGFGKFLEAFKMRALFLWAPIFLVLYGVIFIIRKREVSGALLLSYITAITFFFGYFFSTWGGDIPRYFSPSYMALIITCIGMYASFHGAEIFKWERWGMCFIVLILFIISYQYLINPKLVTGHQHGIVERNFDPGCLYHIPIEDLQLSDANFIAKGIGSDDAMLLADKHNLRLCY